jgi:predicted RNase H-like HicB family nuclease
MAFSAIVDPCHSSSMVERIEWERETGGRWIAEIASIPGAMAYGASRDQAVALALEVALWAVVDRTLSDDDTPLD